MDLISLEGLVAMGLSFMIEGNGQKIRPLFPQDLQEHIGETKDRIGGLALGSGKIGDRVKGPVEVTAAVDQI
jgi:hypothetical protein